MYEYEACGTFGFCPGATSVEVSSERWHQQLDEDLRPHLRKSFKIRICLSLEALLLCTPIL